jgi:hypothetical protein
MLEHLDVWIDGMRMGGPRVGYFTALLMAVSPLHLEL